MSTQASPPGPEAWDRKMTWGRFFAASLLPVILITGAIWFYSTHPLPRFTLTFVAVDTERVFSTISPYGRGMEREMAESFCGRYGLKLQWLRVRTPEQAWQALLDGRAQVMVGAGWRPERIPSGAHIAPGPVYESHSPVLLSNTRRPLEIMRPRVCDHTIPVQPQPAMISALKAFGWEQGCRVRYDPLPDMRLRPLLAGQNERSSLPYFVLDSAQYRLVQPFYHRVRPSAYLNEALGYRWFWRSDEHMLTERMKAFFLRLDLSGELAELQERYYGFFPVPADYGRVWLLRQAIHTRLPAYRDTILAAARRFRLDPLLLVAVIYQESAFNPGAVSHSGVRGLMQLTTETATRLGATDRTDPTQSIWYGAKYLRRLWDRLTPLNLGHWDRWSLAIAAYNQGIGHIFDAMLLAKRLGRDPRTWRNVRSALLKLQQEEYHAGAVYGFTRGDEGADYVDRIRFYYYVLKGWSSLPGLELQELAPFRLSLADLGIIS